MNTSVWYDCFLKALYEKYPKKVQLTEALMELLSIEREAVYRRLRKNVAFSAHDMAKISNAWDISIDNALNVVSEDRDFFYLDILSDSNPKGKNQQQIKNYLHVLETITASPASEYMEISNTLPSSLLQNYPLLLKLHIYIWWYYYGNNGNTCPFSQFELPEKILQLETQYYDKIKNISHVNYMWDNQIIQHLIDYILYLESIYALSKEEIQLFKQEISRFLDEMEILSMQGKFAGDNENKQVDMYISNINIDSNYYYFHSPRVNIFGIKVFFEYIVASTNKSICENFKKWMLAQKKISIPISQVNEKQRIEFFKQQREILEKM